MAKKEKGASRRRPRSEVEVPLKKGAYVWVEPNPPSYSAFECECRSNCGTLIWGGNLAVRDHKGAYLSLTCAIHDGVTNREEAKQSFPELLRLKQGDTPAILAPEPQAPEPQAPKPLPPEPQAPKPQAPKPEAPRVTRKKRPVHHPASKPSAPSVPKPADPKPPVPVPLPSTKPLAPKPPAPLPTPAPEPTRKQKAKEPRPKLPQSMSPKLKGNLAADALENAPQHVREKLSRRRDC